MDKTKKKSKRSAKNVVATDDMIDQYIQAQETNRAEVRRRRESQAESILEKVKKQHEEALIKFRKYDQMTLGELKNVPFEDTTPTKRIRKNRSKSAEAVKVAPSERKLRSSRSASGPKIDETPTESSQAAGMKEWVVTIHGTPLRMNERLMEDIEKIRKNLIKIIEEAEKEDDHN